MEARRRRSRSRAPPGRAGRRSSGAGACCPRASRRPTRLGLARSRSAGESTARSSTRRADPGRVALELGEHALGVGLGRLRPVRAAISPSASPAIARRERAHLHPDDMLARRRARWVDGRGLPDDEQRLRGQQPGARLRVDAGEIVEVGGDVDVGEAREVLARAPRDRRRRARGAPSSCPARRRSRGAARAHARSDGAGAEQASVEDRRREVGDHRAARVDPLAAGELDRRSRGRPRRSRAHLGARGAARRRLRASSADERVDQPRGAAARERDPRPHVGERLEEREHRAAGDVGAEVQVHAPAGEERLGLAASRGRRRPARASS